LIRLATALPTMRVALQYVKPLSKGIEERRCATVSRSAGLRPVIQMNRGNRYRILRLALVILIVGLAITGVCLGSPGARKKRDEAEACARTMQVVAQPVQPASGRCRNI
jgi:hypothetical protein